MILLSLSMIAISWAESSNRADDIMKSIASKQQWTMVQQELSLTIHDGKKIKEYRIKTEMRQESDAFYCHTRFISPQNVSNTQIVWIDRVTEDDSMWLYLPALKRITTLNDKNRSRAFMGSDFEFNDFLLLNLPQEHRLESETPTTWVIQSTPNPSVNTPYNKWVSTVEKSTGSPSTIQLFTNDTPVKELTIQTVDANGLPKQSTMKNLTTGSQTILEIHTFDNHSEIPLDHFTKEYLLQSISQTDTPDAP